MLVNTIIDDILPGGEKARQVPQIVATSSYRQETAIAGVGMARTPSRWLQPGAVVRVEIGDIATLENSDVAGVWTVTCFSQ